jgi:hypothetical protein
MPRLTNKQYLERHRVLRRIWLEDQGSFGVISYNRQMDAHIYYAPARDWSDDQMIKHRVKVTDQDAGLPQRASRDYLEIEEVLKHAREHPAPVARIPAGERKIRVTAIARPEIDAEKLAQALLDLARQQSQDEREKAA